MPNRVNVINADEVAFDYACTESGDRVAMLVQDGAATLQLNMNPDQADVLSRDLLELAMRARNAGNPDNPVIGKRLRVRRLRSTQPAAAAA